MPDETTSYILKAIPPDIYKIILREQNRIKEQKGKTIYSMEATIYHIIKEFDKCQKERK